MLCYTNSTGLKALPFIEPQLEEGGVRGSGLEPCSMERAE